MHGSGALVTAAHGVVGARGGDQFAIGRLRAKALGGDGHTATQGNAVVVQLVSTAEAMLNRRLADLSDREREALEIDLSPREYV